MKCNHCWLEVEQRTPDQNRLYWPNISIIYKNTDRLQYPDTESIANEIKEALTVTNKLKMCTFYTNKAGKERVSYISTSTLNKEQWKIVMEYIYTIMRAMKLQPIYWREDQVQLKEIEEIFEKST